MSEESSFIQWTKCFVNCWKTITATFTISSSALCIAIALKLDCLFIAEFAPISKKFRFKNFYHLHSVSYFRLSNLDLFGSIDNFGQRIRSNLKMICLVEKLYCSILATAATSEKFAKYYLANFKFD